MSPLDFSFQFQYHPAHKNLLVNIVRKYFELSMNHCSNCPKTPDGVMLDREKTYVFKSNVTFY